MLKKLSEQLFMAQTASQLESIKEAALREITSLAKEGLKKEEIEKLKESLEQTAEIKRMFIIEKDLAGLRKQIEELSKTSPQEARRLEESLQKIRESPTNENLQKELDNLKEYLKSKAQEEEARQKPEEIEGEGEGSWQIYILPFYLVMPTNANIALKTVAIYNKIFIKELGPDLEWFSSQPYVAWVDKKGTVHSLSKGDTKISAKYKGVNSQEVEVTVVDKIDEQLDKAVERGLVR